MTQGDVILNFLLTTVSVLLLAIIGIAMSHKLKGSKRSFGVGVALAAGVMLATSFVHLIPEAINHWDGCSHDHSASTESTNEFSQVSLDSGSDGSGCHCGGDHSAEQESIHHAQQGPIVSDIIPGTQLNHVSPVSDTTDNTVADPITPIDIPVQPQPPHVHGPECLHNRRRGNMSAFFNSLCSPVGQEAVGRNSAGTDGRRLGQDCGEEGCLSTHTHSPHEHVKHTEPYPVILTIVAASFICLVLLQQMTKMILSRRARAAIVPKCCDSHHHHPPKEDDTCKPEVNNKCCDDVAPLANMSQISAYAMFAAMCFHAVIEGVSLGVTRDQALWSSFTGIALHKVFEAFAVGASLLEAKVPRARFFIYTAIFCAASPIGAIAGFLASVSEKNSHSKSVLVLTAIAAGTFIQVAVMEMLPKVFESQKDFTMKMAAIVIGFSAICASTALFPHSH